MWWIHHPVRLIRHNPSDYPDYRRFLRIYRYASDTISLRSKSIIFPLVFQFRAWGIPCTLCSPCPYLRQIATSGRCCSGTRIFSRRSTCIATWGILLSALFPPLANDWTVVLILIRPQYFKPNLFQLFDPVRQWRDCQVGMGYPFRWWVHVIGDCKPCFTAAHPEYFS